MFVTMRGAGTIKTVTVELARAVRQISSVSGTSQISFPKNPILLILLKGKKAAVWSGKTSIESSSCL